MYVDGEGRVVRTKQKDLCLFCKGLFECSEIDSPKSFLFAHFRLCTVRGCLWHILSLQTKLLCVTVRTRRTSRIVATKKILFFAIFFQVRWLRPLLWTRPGAQGLRSDMPGFWEKIRRDFTSLTILIFCTLQLDQRHLDRRARGQRVLRCRRWLEQSFNNSQPPNPPKKRLSFKRRFT